MLIQGPPQGVLPSIPQSPPSGDRSHEQPQQPQPQMVGEVIGPRIPSQPSRGILKKTPSMGFAPRSIKASSSTTQFNDERPKKKSSRRKSSKDERGRKGSRSNKGKVSQVTMEKKSSSHDSLALAGLSSAERVVFGRDIVPEVKQVTEKERREGRKEPPRFRLLELDEYEFCLAAEEEYNKTTEDEPISYCHDASLQLVLVDHRGCVADAVFEENPYSQEGMVEHKRVDVSCPVTGKVIEKMDLCIADLGQVKENIGMIVVLATTKASACSLDIPPCSLVVVNKRTGEFAGKYPICHVQGATGNIVACLRLNTIELRHDKKPLPEDEFWTLTGVNEPVCDGRHFMDCLRQIRFTIVRLYPDPHNSSWTDLMPKHHSAVVFAHNSRRLNLTVSWFGGEMSADLDASAIVLGKDGSELESVFFGNLKSREDHSVHGAITHFGDSLGQETQAGGGGDENIQIELSGLGQKVHCIYIVVTIYSIGKFFTPGQEPCIALVDPMAGVEICKFYPSIKDDPLSQRQPCSAFVMGRICRFPRHDRWGFQALGFGTQGRTYEQCLPELRQQIHDDEFGGPLGVSQDSQELGKKKDKSLKSVASRSSKRMMQSGGYHPHKHRSCSQQVTRCSIM